VRDPVKPAPLELNRLLAEAESGANRRGAI